jgi:hypothetical protein
MRACATISGSANAQDEHGKGKDGKSQLDMLAIYFASENGKTSDFTIHGFFSLCLVALRYTPRGFKTGFKRLIKTASRLCSRLFLF